MHSWQLGPPACTWISWQHPGSSRPQKKAAPPPYCWRHAAARAAPRAAGCRDTTHLLISEKGQQRLVGGQCQAGHLHPQNGCGCGGVRTSGVHLPPQPAGHTRPRAVRPPACAHCPRSQPGHLQVRLRAVVHDAPSVPVVQSLVLSLDRHAQYLLPPLQLVVLPVVMGAGAREGALACTARLAS